MVQIIFLCYFFFFQQIPRNPRFVRPPARFDKIVRKALPINFVECLQIYVSYAASAESLAYSVLQSVSGFDGVPE